MCFMYHIRLASTLEGHEDDKVQNQLEKKLDKDALTSFKSDLEIDIRLVTQQARHAGRLFTNKEVPF